MKFTRFVESIEFFGLTQETQETQETEGTLALDMRYAPCALRYAAQRHESGHVL
jgi:hypothetical protein